MTPTPHDIIGGGQSLANGSLLTGLLSLVLLGIPGVLSAQSPPPAKPTEKEDAVTLSPFVVVPEQDQGYRATTTLAGNRLKTELGDIGAAISVMTKEFMDDIGVTDAVTALPYGLNTESVGIQGNFSTGASGTGPQAAPQLEQRIRGIDAAALTRGFFRTRIPADTYNSDSITISRGPNSVLNGVGTAGGVIDNTPSVASLGRSTGEVSLRFDHYGSARGTFNYNQSVRGRLGVRVAGLTERTKYKQEPAYENDDRLYAALTGVLREPSKAVLAQTVVRASYERGMIKSLRPQVLAPVGEFPTWFAPPDLTLDGKYGVSFPAWMKEVPYPAKTTVNNLVTTSTAAVKGNIANNYLGRTFTLVAPNGFTDAYQYQTAQGIQGNIGRLFWNTTEYRRGTNFGIETLPRSVYDSENLLLGGDTGRAIERFDAANITLEQGLFSGKGGIELSLDRQHYRPDVALPYIGGAIRIDVAEHSVTGQPNPNLGRPFIGPSQVTNSRRGITTNNAFRATAFYELDLRSRQGRWGKVLGRHIFSGFYSRDTEDNLNRNYRFAFADTPNLNVAGILGQNLGGANRAVQALVYLGPSLMDPAIKSINDVHIDQQVGLSSILNLKDGDTFRIAYLDPVSQQIKEGDFPVQKIFTGGSIDRSVFKAKLATVQSYLFDGLLVVMFGYREDEREFFERKRPADLPAGVSRILPDSTHNPDSLVLTDVPLVSKGHTFTKSLVGRLPDKWNPLAKHVRVAAHWAQSENFSPTAVRRDVLGRVLPAPFSDTTEKGITFERADRKVSVRFNWYETGSSLATINIDNPRNAFTTAVVNPVTAWNNARLAGTPFATAYASALRGVGLPNAVAAGAKDPGYTSYDQVINAYINAYPEPPRGQYNPRFQGNDFIYDTIDGIWATQGRVAKGFEVELAGNITKGLQMALTVAKQNTVTANSAPVARPFVDQVAANLDKAGLYYMYNRPTSTRQLITDFNSQVYRGIVAAQANDGTRLVEQRQWRVNVATNYAFPEGSPLAGFGVGAAVRYQSRVAVGYPIENRNGIWFPLVANPVWGPAETNGDVWIKYQRRLQFGERRIVWKAQLNVRNAIGGDDRIPTYGNPDGTFGRYRLPLPREVFLTNTFSF